MDCVWVIACQSRTDGRLIRSSLEPIAAVTEHEAWGRVWASLLTNDITPQMCGDHLSFVADGCHFTISIFREEAMPHRSAGHSPSVTDIDLRRTSS